MSLDANLHLNNDVPTTFFRMAGAGVSGVGHAPLAQAIALLISQGMNLKWTMRCLIYVSCQRVSEIWICQRHCVMNVLY